MSAKLDLLMQPLWWEKSPRDIVGSSTHIEQCQLHELANCVDSSFHFIFHSTVPFNIPVHQLETYKLEWTVSAKQHCLRLNCIEYTMKWHSCALSFSVKVRILYYLVLLGRAWASSTLVWLHGAHACVCMYVCMYVCMSVYGHIPKF